MSWGSSHTLKNISDTDESNLESLTQELNNDDKKTAKILDRVGQLEKALKSIKNKKKEADKVRTSEL